MTTSKTMLTLFVLFYLTLHSGCSDDKLAKLQTAFEGMQSASEEFVETLTSVSDEASAKQALPRLETACENMFLAGQALDEASKTTLRTATTIKAEIDRYRQGQKKQVDEQLARISENPEARAVLEPLLEKYGLK